jgi:hypothetical protein
MVCSFLINLMVVDQLTFKEYPSPLQTAALNIKMYKTVLFTCYFVWM